MSCNSVQIVQVLLGQRCQEEHCGHINPWSQEAFKNKLAGVQQSEQKVAMLLTHKYIPRLSESTCGCIWIDQPG